MSSNRVPSEKKHCCLRMTETATFVCEAHPNRFDCPDALIDYNPQAKTYGLIIHDGGSSSVSVTFCPWCGSPLSV